MKSLIRRKRQIAACLLMIMALNIGLPSVSYALTSGPAQPEMKGFEPAGTSNLVDVFSGDFTYNIPLMDVGGYPVNIAYHSGSGMDDEASWVGFGWSLNPGVVDRQMRGLPDDFNGDKIIKHFNVRKEVTGGVNFAFDPEVFGFKIGKIAQVGLSAGVFYNNKRGLGVEFGLNPSAPILSTNSTNAGTNTAGLSASAKLNFNSQNGASFNPSINISTESKKWSDFERSTGNLSLGASISSRAGLQYTSLGISYKAESNIFEKKQQIGTSFQSYVAQPFLPETQADFFNQSYAVSPQLGPQAWGFFAGMQLTGHYSTQKVANPVSSYNAYGFLHNHEGRNDARGLMDFNREKDVPYFEGVPNLPVPVATPDLFMATAQDGVGQYRAYPGGTGIFGDHDAFNTSVSGSLGVEFGAGGGFKVGADVQGSVSRTVTTKWRTGNKLLFQDDNKYEAFGNFTAAGETADPYFEPVYFKRVGEQIPSEGSIYQKVKGVLPVRIKTRGDLAGPTAENVLTGKDNSETPVTSKIVRGSRDVRNNTFQYLTAGNAKVAGLDKKIYDYYLAAGGFNPFLNKCTTPTTEVVQPYKKDHHIGEITITDEGGARKIYGIPAYNTYQEDVSFSIAPAPNKVDKTKGLVEYDQTDASVKNKQGNDFFFSKDIIPAYAHSFLLTGILSNDYVDLKSDGITDDDLGTAVKLNYWRKTNDYKWRTPYANGKANYNEALTSDSKDDRGNYSYGTKELWYVHSIESKTMVAVFETGNREDALGADVLGQKDMADANRQQYLKTIKLYSKADWIENQANAVPVKTVHFVYDYSLFGNEADITKTVPNNSNQAVSNVNIIANQGGKLTLKKIYFTYQQNTKGILQPYEFKYNFNKEYDWKQYDRWGNYKQVTDGNPVGVSNDHYSYSTQDKTKADANAALWQLTDIVTPAGGIIKVQYESDDYSYVQNKKAMQMYPMAGVGSAAGDNDQYYRDDKIYVKLPQPVASNADLLAKYFNGGLTEDSRNLYFKAYVRLKKNEELFDYVAGYAEIENVRTDVKVTGANNDIAEIKVKKIKGENVLTEFHPIAKAAWQFMRLNTPRLVYPGYNVSEDAAPLQFVKALLGAISSIQELMAPFDDRAEKKNLANSIDLTKSWVRLDATTNSTKTINGTNYYAKLGGGSRVKQVTMSDEWNNMAGPNAETAVYGMAYDYTATMKLSNGTDVKSSSGVASYEPMIGNDENPFHQPNKYEQKIKLGPNNAYFIDDPICESYFPGASVGYSQVTVRNIGADGQTGATGYSVSEFYTARDYPTFVNQTPIDVQNFGGAGILQILKIKKNNSRVATQGYTVELNDMHGKPKSEKIVDKQGNELSSAYYYYKTVNQESPEKRLSNEAIVLQKNGNITSAVIGRDVEMYSDMRSQTSYTAGVNVMFNVDAIYVLIAVIPIPTILPIPNAEYTGFRSASVIKVIQHYGIMDKVIKRQNGSQITTENLAWDANTGEVLLTRTQNEFDDPVYNLNYPSHWSYDEGMGPAYKNIGLVISGFSTNANGVINSGITQYFVSGDELLIDNVKYWVNDASSNKSRNLVLINKDGLPVQKTGNATIIRSGRRNMHSMAIGALVSLANPIKAGKLDIGVFTKVLDANGSVFNDEWAVQAAGKTVEVPCNCPPPTVPLTDLYPGADPGKCIDPNAWSEPSVTMTLPSDSGCLITGQQYGSWGADIYKREPNGTFVIDYSSPDDDDDYWSSRVNTLGIWKKCQSLIGGVSENIGLTIPIFIPETKTYYIGIMGDHNFGFLLDGSVVVTSYPFHVQNWRIYHIYPLTLTAGVHNFQFTVQNDGIAPAALGFELFDNPVEDIIATNASNSYLLNVLFSSAWLVGHRIGDYSCSNTLGLVYYKDPKGPTSTLRCRGEIFNKPAGPCTECVPPTADPVNPYTNGLRGNWRMQKSFAYHTDRESKLPFIPPSDPDVKEKTDIRRSGTYTSYAPFWKFESNKWLSQEQQSVRDINWVKANEMTVFNQKGQELENKDALNRYSAAQFGYHHSVATAVASNARYTSIAYDGFEDYDFDLDNCNASTDSCSEDDHFSLRRLVSQNPNNISPVATEAHSGRNSLKVTSSASAAVIQKSVLPVGGSSLYTFTGSSMFLTDDGVLKGFRPEANKKYLLSAWIKEDQSSPNVQLGPALETGKAAIDITTGGQSFTTVKAGPRVEGWRKVEITFLVSSFATDITIRLRPGNSDAYFDDIRIHPLDAQMKTYAYDNRSMRLWAELDENNFATYYEYDDEGILIRVKKETERGVMTIKETRSTYKLKNP